MESAAARSYDQLGIWEIWHRENPTSDKVHMLETRGQTLINLLCLWTLSSKGIERCIPRTPWKNKSRIMSNKLKPGILLGEIKGAPFQTFSDHLLVVGEDRRCELPGSDQSLDFVAKSWYSCFSQAGDVEPSLKKLFWTSGATLGNYKKIGRQTFTSFFSGFRAKQHFLLQQCHTSIFAVHVADPAFQRLRAWNCSYFNPRSSKALASKMRFPAVLPISSNPLNLVQ